MKRFLAMALSLILCLSLSVPAFAAETGDDVYLNVDATGEELTVELIAATAVTDGLVTISFDTDVVSIDEMDYTVSGKVTMHSINASEEGTVKISWISAEAATGTLFTFAFVKTAGTSVSEDTFTVSGTATDEDGNTITIGVNVETVDKSVLEKMVEACAFFTEESYTEESWAELEEALAAAEAVLEDTEATQAEVDEALAALVSAIEGLTLVDNSADKTALQALYTSAQLLSEDDYTEESWAAFEEELANALAVLDDEDATQEEVDAAFDALVQAIAALDPASEEEVNKEALLLVYEASLKLTEESWTEESWAALEEAQEAALAVLNDEDATQEEVDAALAALTDAIAALAAAANKEALEACVDAAGDLEESNYTEESWAAFEEALAAAETVLNDGNATQEEVDAALADLLAAEEALVLKTASTGSEDETTAGSEDDTTTAGSEDDTTTASDSEDDATTAAGSEDGTTASGGSTTGTGDSAPVIVFSVMAIAAAAAIVVLLATKKKSEGQ